MGMLKSGFTCIPSKKCPRPFREYPRNGQYWIWAKRPLESVKLSRYACYLIVQNADPSKEVVANGQTYFAIQTRIAEARRAKKKNYAAKT